MNMEIYNYLNMSFFFHLSIEKVLYISTTQTIFTVLPNVKLLER